MKTQKGSVHVAIVIVLVVALLGALGFIYWQNFINKDQPAAKVETVKKVDNNDSKNTKALKITELGKTLDLSNAKYDDIAYVRTSVNINDSEKNIIAIYSKDLNARLIADAKVATPDQDYSNSYIKFSANRAVYAYYYDESADMMGADMIDGVARNIIDPTNRVSSSKLYVGFMGPGSPSNQTLSEENLAFRDWVVANLK